MLRRTLTILSLISLLLSVGLWGVSYWNVDYYGRSYEFEISAGGVSLIHAPAEAEAVRGRWSWGRFHFDSLKRTRWLPSADLAEWPAGYWETHVPLWPPAFLLTALLCALHRTSVRSALTAASLRLSIRRLLIATSVVGLLAALSLWGLSYMGLCYGPRSSLMPEGPRMDGDRMIFVRMKRDWIEQRVGLYSGRAVWYKSHLNMPVSFFTPVFANPPDPTTNESAWYTSGFRGFETLWAPTFNSRFIYAAIPLWIPALIFTLGLAATRPIHTYRRRKRKKLGLCLKCGYDLRGSKDKCPECGTFVRCDARQTE